MQPNRPVKQEFEYTRHGTTTLTAGLDVVTGEIVSPTLEATRTEPEFVQHIARTVNSDPTGHGIFIVDNLITCYNTTMDHVFNWTDTGKPTQKTRRPAFVPLHRRIKLQRNAKLPRLDI